MKKEVTLQFPSLRAVYLFCAATRLDVFELSTHSLVLSCTCTEEDMHLAVIRYGAKLASAHGARLGRLQP